MPFLARYKHLKKGFNMASKIEQSEYRAMIEKWIVDGVSFQDIAKRCKSELGLDVSHMTVKRHCDSNPDLVATRASNQNASIATGLTPDDIKSLDNRDLMSIDTSSLPTDSDNVRAYARQTLEKIYLNQLLIVENKQQLFMQGIGLYPQSEINGLKAIISCLGQLTNGDDNILKGGKFD